MQDAGTGSGCFVMVQIFVENYTEKEGLEVTTKACLVLLFKLHESNVLIEVTGRSSRGNKRKRMRLTRCGGEYAAIGRVCRRSASTEVAEMRPVAASGK